MEVDELPKNWPSEFIWLHYEKKVQNYFAWKVANIYVDARDDWCWFWLRPFVTFVEPIMACFTTKEFGYFNLIHFEQKIVNMFLTH